MNFEQMQQAYREFDEVMPIGKTVEQDGGAYHIVGMTRIGRQAELYIIGEAAGKDESVEEVREQTGEEQYTNRMSMKSTSEQYPLFNIRTIKIGERELDVQGANTGPVMLNAGYAVDADSANILLFWEMMRAGWRISEDDLFFATDWSDMWLTKMDFQTETDSLPVWNGQDILVKYGRWKRSYYIEKPVCLTVGEEAELEFMTGDGRNGRCYLNKVFPVDIWKENEERFKDPRYLEVMSAEELEAHKKEFFGNLEKDCPKGMCYLGIEYECTLEGSLAFYDRAFLEAELFRFDEMLDGGKEFVVL